MTAGAIKVLLIGIMIIYAMLVVLVLFAVKLVVDLATGA